MWSVGSLELPTPIGSHYMSLPSPTSGLFDSSVPRELTDPLDFDLDLLSTLNSPPASIKSCESTSDDALMMDNWQMNEVFQDIPDIDDGVLSSHVSRETGGSELDLFLKHVLDNDAPAETVATIEATVKPPGITEFTTEAVIPVDLDLKTVVDEAFGSQGLEGYDLLNELESMECAHVLTAASDSTESSTSSAVESDHQYTQLSKVEIKPNETKKQAIRRVKNNAASKVCRKQRKTKFAVNQIKAEELTKANRELLENINSVQSVVDLLKEHLVKATCKK